MQNLILTTNIILPIFLLMVIGYLCKLTRLLELPTFWGMNKAVFKLFLPVSLCKSLMSLKDFSAVNVKVLLFGSLGIFALFVVGMAVVPIFVKENARRGVIIQTIFRSNYAIFGVPLAEALFPNSDGAIAAMMVVATVPVFNVLAVVTLEIFRGGRVNVKKVLLGILKNPLIWGCAVGFAIAKTGIQLPEFALSTINKLAAVASPLALFALGGTIEPYAIRKNAKALFFSIGARLVAIPAVMLTIAYLMGIRGESFGVLMIVFAAPCAVSSYTMAVQMDGDGDLAAQQVMLSTVLSSVTVFLLIFIFKTMGLF